MKIYNQEQLDGLTDAIQDCQSLSYTSKLEKVLDSLIPAIKEYAKFKSLSSKDDKDLYYTRSVLVTSNWNLNDDVFDKGEVWKARHTPSHKPTNLEHDEKQLVGHITENWAINKNGDIISESVSENDLPDIFHIVNGSVIYRSWQDSKLSERAETLIGEIEEGKKYVSMECLFTNFDYAVISPDNQYNVVARTEQTSWMTKHLRAYGGKGEYEGYRIGRLLRNITFSGKGFVDKPANPNSIIFSKDDMFKFGQASYSNPFEQNNLENGVNIEIDKTKTIGETHMSDILEKQNAELKEELKNLKVQLDEASAKMAKANIEKYEKTIEELTISKSSLESQIDDTALQYEELKEKCEALSQELEDVKKSESELRKRLAEEAAAKLKTDRISTLVDGGVEKEVAEKKVELFSNLNDEQFAAVSEEIISATKSKEEEPAQEEQAESQELEEQEEEQDEAEANATEETLEEVEEKEDVSMAVENEPVTDERADIREKLSLAFAKEFGQEDNPGEEK
jgi:hypothetical protein